MLILTILQGPDKGKTFELPDDEPQLLGRSSEALPFTDTTVSRRHAELTPDNGQWWLNDLNSQNGTYLNGQRIDQRAILHVGDQIRVGSTLLVFGRREDALAPDVLRVLRADQIDTAVERTLVSNEDSVVLAEPEPGAAASHHLQMVYRLTALTSGTLDRETLLRGIMELVFNEFRPERGFILLARGDERHLRPAVVKYRRSPIESVDKRINVSRTILQHALRKGEGVLSTNAMSDPRFAAGDSVQQLHIRSAICAPIKFQERNFGAIYIDSSVLNYTFTADQLALMTAIGRHTGLALATIEAHHKQVHTQRLAAVGETVASLSHSIKNILQGLRGGGDLVELALKKNDLALAQNGWEILKRNLDRIRRLSLNMLAYSRQQALEFQLTDLGALLEDCAELLHDACTTKRIALILDVDPDTPPIAVDPNLMHQALMNLLVNAVDAVDNDRGAVTVRAAFHTKLESDAPGGVAIPYARIDVIDNGPGIPPERHRLIFEPFHTTKGLKGTGLGLAAASRIVEDHRGRITLASDEDEGAVFSVFIPAGPAAPADPSATAGPKLPASEAEG